MKFLSEYRDQKKAEQYATAILKITTRPWTIMEVCGGQTHAIVKFGIDKLLPQKINLVHGPGCPVCVTPLELIDKAIQIASQPKIIFCSFGDMLRVPGSNKDLLTVKSAGGDIRIVYSPLDALKIAQSNPDKKIVFFAVGFETTAPANAMAIYQAQQKGIKNFLVLVSHVLVPPAIQTILGSPDNKVQGFLAAGHVCTIMGYTQYQEIVKKYQIPIVVTGFEPLDILQGTYMCIKQLEEGKAKLENQYTRSVCAQGNIAAQKLMEKVFTIGPRKWRGVGEIMQSGLALHTDYAPHDAELHFGLTDCKVEEPKECISGLVLQGIKKPHQCSAFGTLCTPERPLGATMVSNEGACAAYYQYRNLALE